MGERKEALIRIPVGIIACILLELWEVLIRFLLIIHFFYTLITGKRSKPIANFANKWINYQYRFERYINFTTNDRIFPFRDFHKELEKVDMRKLK